MSYTTIYSEPFADAAPVWEGSSQYRMNPSGIGGTNHARATNYPYVSGTIYQRVDTGTGPNGNNFLGVTPPGTNHTIEFQGYGPWDATCGRMSFDIRMTAADIAAIFAGTQYFPFAILKSNAGAGGGGVLQLMFRPGSTVGSTHTGDLRMWYPAPAGALTKTDSTGITFTIDEWWRYWIAWECGSNVAQSGAFSDPTADSDGQIVVTRQRSDGSGSVETLFTITGIPLYVNPGPGYHVSYPDPINTNNWSQLAMFEFGNYALEQCVPDVAVDDGAEICCDSDQTVIKTEGGGTSSGAKPLLIPIIGSQIECAGGGLVDEQAPLTFAETWW